MRRQLEWVVAVLLVASSTHAATIFTDWETVDTAGDAATGTLGAISVSISGGDIDFAVTDGSSGVFANPTFFSPAISSGDWVEITGSFTSTFTYTITFSAPVTDPILHIGSLASTITFSGITPTKLSGEAEFVVAGSTVTGQSPLVAGGSDRNGTIMLSGTFSSITFDVDALGMFTNDRDGIAFQVGADSSVLPEPSVVALACAGLFSVLVSRRRKQGARTAPR